MEESFIFKLLVDPLTKVPLQITPDKKQVKSSSGDSSYAIIENVPCIIKGDCSEAERSDLHKKYDSTFRYHEHYEADAKLFNYFSNNESAAMKHETRRLHETIIFEIKMRDALILDAGCGNGWAAEALVNKGNRVISMDISVTNPVGSLKRTPHQNHAGLIADVYSMPFQENTFDYIIASEVLEHVSEPALFIRVMLNILKPGGRLIISTPYNEKIEYCLCVHCNRMTPRHAHLHSFNEKNIAGYFPADGISWKSYAFSSRYLTKLKLHVLLQLVPFSIWRLKDMAMNKLFGNEMRLMAVVTKI